MTKDEAIYCMKTYIGENGYTDCFKCPYYGKKVDGQVKLCCSDEAHRMALKALQRDDPEVEFQKRFEKTTFCGYSSLELLLFADVCRNVGITTEELHNFSLSVDHAFKYVYQKIHEQLEKDIEKVLS